MFMLEKLRGYRGKAYAVFFCHSGRREIAEEAEVAERSHGVGRYPHRSGRHRHTEGKHGEARV
jgi:hypothetical protein